MKIDNTIFFSWHASLLVICYMRTIKLMKNLKLHSEGKEDFLRELEIEYNQRIKEVENDNKLSQENKDQAIKKLKNKHQRLISQSRYYLF